MKAGVCERKQHIQRQKEEVLRCVRIVGESQRRGSENKVGDQHGEETDLVDAPPVQKPCEDLHDRVDDHVERDVRLVHDLPIVHAVHEDRLEAQTAEQWDQTEHLWREQQLQNALHVSQNGVLLTLQHFLRWFQFKEDRRTDHTHGAEEDEEDGSRAVPSWTSSRLDIHEPHQNVGADVPKYLCWTRQRVPTAPII